MASFNSVTLMGNLTRDPELKHTPAGKAVCQIGLAINHKAKGGAEEVTFVDVEMWERTAENCAQYCKKGEQVLIYGRLKQDSWEDKSTGARRSKLKVVCIQLVFLGGKSGSSGGGQQTQHRARPPLQTVPADESPF